MTGMRAYAATAGGACVALATAWAVLGTPSLRVVATTALPHGHHMTAGTSVAERPATTVRQLMCEPLPDVPGKNVTTALVHFPPHAYTAAHRHPGSVTAYVLAGTVRSQLDGGAPRTYRAGEAWFEPRGMLHVFAENPLDEPADVLATFVTEADCGPLTIYEPRFAERSTEKP